MSKRKTVLPAHMKKTIERVEELASSTDLVLEVVDARAPDASRCRILTKLLPGAFHVITLAKADIADPSVTRAWIRSFEQQGTPCTVLPHGNKFNASDFLASLRVPFYGEQGRMLKALIVGIPNVGKSTLINRLAKRKSAAVGAMPGITRGLQLIRLDKGIFLYDTPGVINPVVRNERQGHILGLIGCLQENLFDVEGAGIFLAERILEGPRAIFEKAYDLSLAGINESEALADALARRRGFLLKGGAPDMPRALRILARDFATGRLAGVSLEMLENNFGD